MDLQDPFYKVATHNNQRPRGFYVVDRRVDEWVLRGSDFADFRDAACQIGMVTDIGDAPDGWKQALENRGCTNVKIGDCSIMNRVYYSHISLICSFQRALDFLDRSKSRGVAAVRFMPGTNPALMDKLAALPEQKMETHDETIARFLREKQGRLALQK